MNRTRYKIFEQECPYFLTRIVGRNDRIDVKNGSGTQERGRENNERADELAQLGVEEMN